MCANKYCPINQWVTGSTNWSISWVAMWPGGQNLEVRMDVYGFETSGSSYCVISMLSVSIFLVSEMKFPMQVPGIYLYWGFHSFSSLFFFFFLEVGKYHCNKPALRIWFCFQNYLILRNMAKRIICPFMSFWTYPGLSNNWGENAYSLIILFFCGSGPWLCDVTF